MRITIKKMNHDEEFIVYPTLLEFTSEFFKQNKLDDSGFMIRCLRAELEKEWMLTVWACGHDGNFDDEVFEYYAHNGFELAFGFGLN